MVTLASIDESRTELALVADHLDYTLFYLQYIVLFSIGPARARARWKNLPSNFSFPPSSTYE